MQMKSLIPNLALSVCCLAAASIQAGEMFFKDKKSDYRIYISANAEEPEAYAAEELQNAIRKISETKIEIVKSDSIPAKNAIVIGSLKTTTAVKSLAEKLKLANKSYEELAVYNLDGNLYLAGNIPRAALYATYSFLQNQFGVRWFWYGDDGEFMPERTSFELPELKWNYAPPVRFRALDPCGAQGFVPVHQWLPRLFVNSSARKGSDGRDYSAFSINQVGGHCIRMFDNEFEQYPDCFGMLNGKRDRKVIAGCWSNPKFLELMVDKLKDKMPAAEVIEPFPADVTERCECGECAKIKDWSSRWFTFYGKLAGELKKINPNLTVSALAYQEYRYVPDMADLSWIDYVDYCGYNFCYVHALNDPKCGINRLALGELKKWSERVKPAVYGYEFDSFGGDYYMPMWNGMSQSIKCLRDMGAVRIKTEQGIRTNIENPYLSKNHIQRLSYYLYCMMIWNPDADVDGLLADFCNYVYGPASKQMLEYHKEMAKAWDSIDGHVTYFKAREEGTAKFFVSLALGKKMDKLFDDAEKAIDDEHDAAKRLRWKNNVMQDRVNLARWMDVFAKNPRKMSEVKIPLLIGADNSEKAALLPLGDDAKNPSPAEMKAWRTDDALHVSYVCRNPEIIKNPIGAKESKNWGSSSIELFLDLCDDSAYYQFAVINPAGALYKANAFTKIPDFKMDVSSKVTDEGWFVDMKIPFSSLGKTPKKGDKWRIVSMLRTKGFQSAGFPLCAYHDMNSAEYIVFE